MMALMNNTNNRFSPNRQSGLSLVELMISVTLGLVIMAGVVQMYATSRQNANTADSAARMQENIRYAFGRIGDDLARAGNYGCFNLSGWTGNVVDSVANTVWGDFDTTFVSGDNEDSLNDANVLDATDTLVVKYVDHSSRIAVSAQPTSATQLTLENAVSQTQNNLLLISDCERAYVYLPADIGAAIDANPLTTPTHVWNQADNYNSTIFVYSGETGAHRYYIDSGTNGVCSTNNGNQGLANCSLFRGTNNVAAEEIVQGVHSMQVQYGVETGANILYSDVPADWSQVDRVRISLVFNSINTATDFIQKPITRVFAVRNKF